MEPRQPEILATVTPSAPRRMFATGVMGMLGILLELLAFLRPPESVPLQFMLIGFGVLALVGCVRLYSATSRGTRPDARGASRHRWHGTCAAARGHRGRARHLRVQAVERVRPAPERTSAPGLGAGAVVAVWSPGRGGRRHFGGRGTSDGRCDLGASGPKGGVTSQDQVSGGVSGSGDGSGSVDISAGIPSSCTSPSGSMALS